MPVAVTAGSLSSLVTPEGLENAAKEVDRQLAADRQYPELAEQINASQGTVLVLLLRCPSCHVEAVFAVSYYTTDFLRRLSVYKLHLDKPFRFNI